MHFGNDSFFGFSCIHSIPLSSIRFGYLLCEHKSLLDLGYYLYLLHMVCVTNPDLLII